VSALAFTPSLFTLEWTHPPNREQPDGAADLLNTNSQSVLQFTTVMSYISQTTVYILWIHSLRSCILQGL